MLWDFILFIKKIYKQQTCVHDYMVDNLSVRLDNVRDMQFCKKCKGGKCL